MRKICLRQSAAAAKGLCFKALPVFVASYCLVRKGAFHYHLADFLRSWF
jgi:hypothetical protein